MTKKYKLTLSNKEHTDLLVVLSYVIDFSLCPFKNRVKRLYKKLKFIV